MKTKTLLYVTALLITANCLLPSSSFAQTIAGGFRFSVALCSDGTVNTWGYNFYGTLGNGTNTSSNVPVQVSALTGITAIAAGEGHCLALKNDGTVRAWGYNSTGGLGNGNNTNSNVPVQVSALTGITAIEAAGDFSLALKNDGTVWAWGSNGNGTLGNGTTTNSNVPVQVSALTGIIAIARGGAHAHALKNDGTVWAWGANNVGQLGIGNNTGSNVPVQVSALTGIIAIAGGSLYHSLALKNDGTVWAWGANGSGELGNGTTTNSNVPVQVSALTGITAIAAGGYHSLAIKNDGTVWAWGRNLSGQLGNGNNTNSNVPVQVSTLTNIIAIAAGGLHSLALKNDGTVRAWGYNFDGQLANGNNINSNVPVQPIGLCSMLSTCNITNVSANTPACSGNSATFNVSFTVSSGSGVYNVINTANNNILASGSSSPILVTIPNSVGSNININVVDASAPTCLGTPVSVTLPNCLFSTTSISGGLEHSIVLCSSGGANSWGSSEFGQLGNGTNTNSTTPVQVSSLTGATAISGGHSHSLVLKNNGTVWAWGSNFFGPLGNGNNTDSNVPVQVSSLTGVIAIAGGGNHSHALKNDGTVWAWGYNSSGELGIGNNTNSNIPVKVSSLTNITAISGGGIHSLMLKNDGTVWACGYNIYGQLGNGNNTNSNIPVQVSSLSNISAISGGYTYSLALKNDGTVWAWGENFIGQLGNGTNTNSNVPVQVSSLTGIIAISASLGNRSLALKNDGTVWAWGSNSGGQLGNGTTTSSSVPVQVNTLTGIIAIGGGWAHSIAIKNNGTVWAWGVNEFGQLGIGTTTNSSVPVQVTSVCSVLNTCSITNVSANTPVCNGTSATFNVSFTANLGSGSYNVINTANSSILASGSSSPISVTIANSVGGNININVVDASAPTCLGTPISVGLPNCAPVCAISSVGATTATCSGTSAIFNVSFVATNGSGVYNVINTANNSILASGSSSPIGVSLPNNLAAGNITVNVTDASNPGCAGIPIVVALPDCTPPIFCGDNICNGVEDFCTCAADCPCTISAEFLNFDIGGSPIVSTLPVAFCQTYITGEVNPGQPHYLYIPMRVAGVTCAAYNLTSDEGSFYVLSGNTLQSTTTIGNLAIVWLRMSQSEIDLAGGTTTINFSGSGGNCLANRTVTWSNVTNYTGNVATTCKSALVMRVFLTGAYNYVANNGLMRLSLNALLPLNSPYSVAPWNAPAASVTQMPADIVDWALVELRNPLNDNLIESQAGLLAADGYVRNTLGHNGLTFVATGNFKVVVRHRNHVAIISSVSVDPNGGVVNLTIPANVSGGNGQLVNLGDTGLFGLFPGDVNHNGVVTFSDYNAYINAGVLFNTYLDADCNMDGQVNSTDFSFMQPYFQQSGLTQIRY